MDIVRIRLRKPRRVLSFRSDGLLIQRDDPCVVETENGLEWGVCILPPEPCSEEMAKRATMRVVRRANASDLDVFAEIIAEEGRAREICGVSNGSWFGSSLESYPGGPRTPAPPSCR